MSEDAKTDGAEKNVHRLLESTGFISELRAIQILLKRKWACFPNHYYVDPDEKVAREIDIVASAETLADNVRLVLLADVKRRESPIVVFRTFGKGWSREWFESGAVYRSRRSSTVKNCLNTTFAHSVSHKNGWMAHAIHELKEKRSANKDNFQTLHGGIISLCKCCESYAAAISKDVDFILVQPLIILDGELWSAAANDKGELSLNKERFVSLSFAHTPEGINIRRYTVDVVTIDALEDYSDAMHPLRAELAYEYRANP